MNVDDVLKTLAGRDLLPSVLLDRTLDVHASRLLTRNEKPVVLRLAFSGADGFVDVLLPQKASRFGDAISLAGVGTVAGDINIVQPMYPEIFGRCAASSRAIDPPDEERWIPPMLRTWHGRTLRDVIDPAFELECEVYWRDPSIPRGLSDAGDGDVDRKAAKLDSPRGDEAQDRAPAQAPQNINWCVPVAMSEISKVTYRPSQTPAYFASRWGQGPNKLFFEDEMFTYNGKEVTRYEHLKDECRAHRIDEVESWEGQPKIMPWEWLRELKAPTMFADREHAQVAYATSKVTGKNGAQLAGYGTTSIGAGISWVAGDMLYLRFAFTAR